MIPQKQSAAHGSWRGLRPAEQIEKRTGKEKNQKEFFWPHGTSGYKGRVILFYVPGRQDRLPVKAAVLNNFTFA